VKSSSTSTRGRVGSQYFQRFAQLAVTCRAFVTPAVCVAASQLIVRQHGWQLDKPARRMLMQQRQEVLAFRLRPTWPAQTAPQRDFSAPYCSMHWSPTIHEVRLGFEV